MACFLLDQYCRDKNFHCIVNVWEIIVQSSPWQNDLKKLFGSYFFTMHCAIFFLALSIGKSLPIWAQKFWLELDSVCE